MATTRRHVFLPRDTDAVWAVVGDPGALATWFPRVVSATVTDGRRSVVLASGIVLDEEIVCVRDDLRRLQYRLVGPLPIEHHLATIDVLPDGEQRCVVVYSTDVVPHALAFILDGAAGDALDHLARLFDPPLQEAR